MHIHTPFYTKVEVEWVKSFFIFCIKSKIYMSYLFDQINKLLFIFLSIYLLRIVNFTINVEHQVHHSILSSILYLPRNI